MKPWSREGAVPTTDAAGDDGLPAWFAAFLADRGTRKPSAHTMKAYRQDFDAIATLIVGEHEPVAGMPLSAICTDQLRTGFAGVRPNARSSLHPALLVDLERAVHLPVHRRSHPRQPDAPGRTTQDHQDAAKSAAPQCCQ